MRTLTFSRVHNLAQLGAELFAAFPAWTTTNAAGERSTVVQMSSKGAAITLRVPDDADEAAVASVVNAHVANPNYGKDATTDWAIGVYRQAWANKLRLDPPTALTAAEATQFQKATVVLMRRVFRELAP